MKGVIDLADFDNQDKLGKGKEMVDRLSNLVGIFQGESLDFSKNKAGGDDILGDAYEYLMRHFATESGKSKGQFYIPAEVSRVIAKVIGISHAKSQIYMRNVRFNIAARQRLQPQQFGVHAAVLPALSNKSDVVSPIELVSLCGTTQIGQ